MDDVGTTWVSVVLAALNVLQTVALAYLAASRHQERNGSTTSDREHMPGYKT